MKLKIVFLFCVLALVHAEQEIEDDEESECGDEKAGECIANLLITVLSDSSEEEVCRVLKETSQCLDETADECFGDNKDQELEDGLRELRELIAENCPTSLTDMPNEVQECIEGLEDEILECLGDSILQTLDNIVQLDDEQEPDENEIKCSMYESVTKCTVDKVKETCGEEAGRLALEEMLDLPDDIRENCNPPNVKETLKGLMYDVVRRRRK